MIVTKTTSQRNVTNLTEANNIIKDIYKDLNNIVLALQGRLRFGTGVDGKNGENIAGEFQVLTTSATPDAENTIAHGIGSVPIGYLVIKQDKAATFYLGSTNWSATNVYLKSDVASVAITVFLIK